MGELAKINKNGIYHFPNGTTADDIINSITPATSVEIHGALALLFVSRKSRHGSEADSNLTLKVYEMSVSDMPLFAIEAAVKAIIRGDAPNISPTFVPSSDELRSEVRRQMWLHIRVDKPEAPEVTSSLPKGHFSKRWEGLKGAALKNMDVSQKGGSDA